MLLGGGHAHVEVLRQWKHRPVPGVNLTLVTRTQHTPYSGMLPGFVSGFYSFEECHIDLARLSRYAGAALVQQEATGIDVQVGTQGHLCLQEGPGMQNICQRMPNGGRPLNCWRLCQQCALLA